MGKQTYASSRGTTSDLIDDIQNLSIISNTKPIAKSTKIKKKNDKPLSEIKKQPAKTIKKTTVRITKSKRVFIKNHAFGQLLVKPLECGSGCPLFCSTWKEEPSVTK